MRRNIDSSWGIEIYSKGKNELKITMKTKLFARIPLNSVLLLTVLAGILLMVVGFVPASNASLAGIKSRVSPIGQVGL